MSSKRTKLGVGDHKRRTAPPDELVGQTVLDRYLVEAELGSGAMGVVYRGKHVKLGRQVAVKVMHDHLVHERDARRAVPARVADRRRGSAIRTSSA